MVRSTKLIFKWWKTWGTFPVFSWVKAAALYRAGNFELAMEHYKKGLEKNPKHPARFCATLDLAYCMFKTRRITEAETLLKEVVGKLPNSREASMRLARLQMWLGNHGEAARTIGELLERVDGEPELVAYYLLATLENPQNTGELKEAVAALLALDSQSLSHPILEVARACLSINRGDMERGRAVLACIASQIDAPIEAHIKFAEVLLLEGKVTHARRQLRRAMSLMPDHPRLLSLFAETYLVSGTFYNPEFAKQLSSTACTLTAWLSPREMRTMAKAYYHIGDRMAALMVASKAQDTGRKQPGYSEDQTLNELIQTLSTGTLA